MIPAILIEAAPMWRARGACGGGQRGKDREPAVLIASGTLFAVCSELAAETARVLMRASWVVCGVGLLLLQGVLSSQHACVWWCIARCSCGGQPSLAATRLLDLCQLAAI